MAGSDQPPATDVRVDRAARRRARTRARLVDAARGLISARGVAGLRIRDISEAADVAHGSFYNHFASKEELVEAVVHATVERIAAEVLGELDQFSDQAEAAAFAIRRFLSVARHDPETAKLFINLGHVDTAFESAVQPYARVPLERGMADGTFAIGDVDTALVVLTSSALAVIRLMLEGKAAPDADVRHAEAMLRVFGLPPARARAVAAGDHGDHGALGARDVESPS